MKGDKTSIVTAHAEYMRIKRQAELNKFLNYGMIFLFLVSFIIVICTVVAVTIGDAMRSSPRAQEYSVIDHAAKADSVSCQPREMSMDVVGALAPTSAPQFELKTAGTLSVSSGGAGPGFGESRGPATNSQNVAFKALALRTLRGAAGSALKSRDGCDPATGFMKINSERKAVSLLERHTNFKRSKKSFRGFMPDSRWNNCWILPKVQPSYARLPRVVYVDWRVQFVAYPRLLCSVAL